MATNPDRCADCGGPLPPEGHARREVWDSVLKAWLPACFNCVPDDEPDEAYERANQRWRETHGGEL